MSSGPRPLTARQEAVMAVIRSSLAERGHGPTVREIGARVGLSSTSSVAHQLGRLEARGLIARTGRDWSTCVLVEEQPARRPGLRSRGPRAGADGYGQRLAPWPCASADSGDVGGQLPDAYPCAVCRPDWVLNWS
ncbi:hypothetical protein ACH489_19460 [Streptomyces rubiginosohelvolus]|uniref:LexA family protein n=1 Tax=Streptomyces rubiginosohelvolus TaxID=67362 RepID=UPI0037BD80F0